MNRLATIVLVSLCASATAFAPCQSSKYVSVSRNLRESSLYSSSFGEADEPVIAEEGRNPDRPELPEIKGDYNWDEKFAGDQDWLTENVPGKMVLSDLELAAQATALSKIEDRCRKGRKLDDYDDARILGWTGRAETYNGRFAMFFIVVGLLTEYWTGITIPGQIEEMARVGGFIGPDF